MTREQYATWAGKPYEGVKGVVVHHYGNDYDGIVETAKYHVYTQKYRSIAYHVVIQKDGTINYTLPYDRVGYHVAGRNHEFIGVAFTGNLTDAMPTPRQIEAFNWLYGHEQWRHPVFGHVEVALPGHGTACPGNLFSAWQSSLEGRR